MEKIIKYYIINMPDGNRYYIDTMFMAEARADYYAKCDYPDDKDIALREAVRAVELKIGLTDWPTLTDYARGNVNWPEALKHVIKVEPIERVVTDKMMQIAWINPEAYEPGYDENEGKN